ncbi:MAG: hypothetical protein M3Z20_13755 [Chloroflexota bacterium]|nr:hypothetical protein [Chloroflexota bacterium]
MRFRALIVMALAATSLLALGAQVPATAQEATPQPVALDLTTFSTSLIGLLPGVSLPASADILVTRAEFAPGVAVPFAASADAADTLILVEAGELAITVANQPWSISRESVLNQAMASPTADGDLFKLSTSVAPGEDGTLAAGDMTLIPATADGEMQNLTTEPVTALMILLGPSATAAATPTP